MVDDEGLIKHIVEFPAVAVCKSNVIDASHLGVDQRFGAIRVYDVNAQRLDVDKDDGPASTGLLAGSQEGIVNLSVPYSVVGNDHGRICGVPPQRVEEWGDEQHAGTVLKRADGLIVVFYDPLQRFDEAYEVVDIHVFRWACHERPSSTGNCIGWMIPVVRGLPSPGTSSRQRWIYLTRTLTNRVSMNILHQQKSAPR